MKVNVKEGNETLRVEVRDFDENKNKILQALMLCKEGKCECQSDEYKKVESCEVIESDNLIQIDLKPRSSEKIDSNEVVKCIYSSIKKE